jgi:hypothetical protein
VKQLAQRHAIRGLGAMNLCEDPGWNFMQALVGGAGGVVSSLSAGTQYGSVTKGGSTAGRATGAGLTATTTAWQAACAAEAARDADRANPANNEQLQALLAAQSHSTELALAEARRSSEQALQALMLSQQQRGAVAQELIPGVSNQTLLLGGLAIAGVVGLALFLRR